MPVEAAGRRARVVAAIALIALVPFWIAAPLLELSRGERFADTDDPALGIAFLRESGPVTALTGIVLLFTASALVVAVAAFASVLKPNADGLRPNADGGGEIANRAVSIAGSLAAGLLVLAAALRLSSPGPLLYLAGLDPEWGRIGYLVMHLVGTQGAIPAARLVIAVWMIGVVVLAVRRGILAPWTLATLVVPAILLASVLGPIAPSVLEGPAGAVGWVAIMAAFLLGVPAWCLIVAGALLARRPRRTAQPRRSSSGPTR